MSKKQNIKEGFIRFSLLFFSLLIAFLIAELTAKIYIEQFASEQNLKKYASPEQLKEIGYQSPSSLHRYIGYIPTPNYRKGKNKHNRLGLRGEEITLKKPEGIYRIICLGGSTTYTSGVEDYRQSYPDLLEKELKKKGHEEVEVINAGMLSYTTFESLINFQLRLVELEPDLLIIYHAVNDIDSRLVWPVSSYQGDNSAYRIDVNQNLYTDNYSFLDHFNIGRILRRNYSAVEYAEDRLRKQGIAPTSKMFDLRNQNILKTYPEGVFKKASAEKILEQNPPIYFHRNLQYIIALARLKNTQVLLSSFAYSPNDKNNSLYNVKALQVAIAEHNRIIEEVAIEDGTPFFDFASVFPKDPKYYQDDIHVNEKGSALKAKQFANYILEEGILEKKEDSLGTKQMNIE